MSLSAFSYGPEMVFAERVRGLSITPGLTVIAAYNKNIIMIFSKSILL
jgi:hypothetical protein